MSLGTENTAATPTTREPEQAEEPTNGISHDLIKERIRANLNPLNDQISRLTQVLKQLIQEISARIIPAADTVESLTQSWSGNFWSSLASAFGSTGFLPDSRFLFCCRFRAQVSFFIIDNSMDLHLISVLALE